MPDVILTERDHKLLRTLMDCEPVPGSPIPERRVLETIGMLVPSDEVHAVLRVNGGPLLSFAGVPSSASDFEDDPSRWCTLKVGTMRHLRTEPTPALPASLTVAERRVLNHVAAGRSNSQIAERLFVAPSTVRKHLENIYSKLGVTNRMAAVVAVRVPP